MEILRAPAISVIFCGWLFSIPAYHRQQIANGVTVILAGDGSEFVFLKRMHFEMRS